MAKAWLCHKLPTGYFGYQEMINLWMNLISTFWQDKGHQFIIFCHLQKLLVSLFWNNYEWNNQTFHFDGKSIPQDLKAIWTNISISFTWDRFRLKKSHLKEIEILVHKLLLLALLIFHQNKASGYFIHSQNICSDKYF